MNQKMIQDLKKVQETTRDFGGGHVEFQARKPSTFCLEGFPGEVYKKFIKAYPNKEVPVEKVSHLPYIKNMKWMNKLIVRANTSILDWNVKVRGQQATLSLTTYDLDLLIEEFFKGFDFPGRHVWLLPEDPNSEFDLVVAGTWYGTD